MKKTITEIAGLAVLIGGIGLAGCGGGETPQTQGTTQQEAATQMADAAMAYPLDICIVSGEKLGSMGDPVVKTYGNREVKFCCNMCVETFEANPATFIAKIDSTAAAMEMNPDAEPVEELTGHEGHDHG